VDQWSNGTNPAAELTRMLDVRRAALARFGETAIRRNRPLAEMEEVLVPLYLHHRYQVDVAASAVGGMHYIYALRGDGRQPVKPVPASEQRAALQALMRTLKPSELAVPPAVLKTLPPRPSGYDVTRELFPRYTGMMFDAITPAVVAADLTISALLDPARAARIVEQHAVDPALPGLDEVITALVDATFKAEAANSYEAEIARATQRVLVDTLITLATNAPMSQVRAGATLALKHRMNALAATGGVSPERAAHATLMAADIKRFLERPLAPAPRIEAPAIPPGAPIGQPAMEWLRRFDLECRSESGR
jgi:hypothetical protein